MSLPAIHELGVHIDAEWRRHHYDTVVLPAIARDALETANLPSRIGLDEIISWVLHDLQLPQQQDLEARFGQPPVTLFRAPRFYIDALYWVDGSTTIHQHAFSGAFQVLAGASIETTHSYSPDETFDGHFCFGRLRVTATRLHGVGSIQPITSGMGGLIHSLFHLDRPSVTLVVRTYRDAGSGPQFHYTRNGIAADPFFKEPIRERSLQIVRLLQRLDHPQREEMVGDLVARSDIHTAYRVLESCRDISDEALLGRLIKRAPVPGAVTRIAAAFQEERRIGFLYSRRAHVRAPDARFFLGVLLNARRRQDALNLVSWRWPKDDPAAQAASCLRQLSTVTVNLQAGGTAWQPNVLGLPQIDRSGEMSIANELRGAPPGGPAAETLLAELRGLPALRSLFEP
jgi:hypothetical protein